MALSAQLARRHPGRRSFLLWLGAAVVTLFVGLSLAAPLIAPFDPVAYQGGGRLVAPSWDHWFGTDTLGRDIFSRVLHGGRVPLAVAFLSAFLAIAVGASLGWVAGYTGGLLDRTLSLGMDALYSFPALVLAIIIAAVLGPGVLNMVIAVSLVYVPTYFRVARGETLKVREQEYVAAARAIGTPHWWILCRHVAPNTLNSILAVLSFNIADAILTEAGLAFLGLGLPPPAADWGFDLQNGQAYLTSGSWWPVTFPGLAILALVYGFAMLGEGIADRLNPRR